MGKREETLDHKWEMQFFELKKFKKKFGHCDVPQRKKGYIKLARWCNDQRRWKKFRALEYNPDRIRKLNSIGFSWGLRDKWFEKNFKKLEAYIHSNGHSCVFVTQDKSLNKWCAHLREDKKNKSERLATERIKRLESIGFDWEPDENLYDNLHFEERFTQLKEFIQKFKRYPVRGNKKYPFLATWVERQRYEKRYGGLSKDREEKLDKFGFKWEPHTENWENRFKELNLFRKKYGHCNVPHTQANRKQYNLAYWCDRQRQLYKEHSKSLTNAQIEKLNSIEFSWTYAFKQGEVIRNKTSNEVLINELKRLHKKLGRAPIYEDLKKQGKYTKGKYTLRFGGLRNALVQAGLQNADEKFWNDKYKELKLFIEKNKRTPARSEPNFTTLSIWVNNQRRLKKRGQLTVKSIKLLDAIKFEWNPFDTSWETNFEKLKAYKKQFGHCNVPETPGLYEKLGAWVGTQRRLHTKFSSERINKLNSIGFSWKSVYKSN